MILFPPAKVNLGLNVLYKRSDGYHEIDSCMMAIPVFDVLEIIPKEEFSFRQTGLTVDGNLEDNLCLKAFRLFQKTYGIGNVFMHLRKEIPMGAGLGGGSADAAYVLMGLNEIFQVGVSDADLEELAAQLGSDCPFFIKNVPQITKGRGEILKPIDVDVDGYSLKVVNPGIHVGTREAYAGIEYRNEPLPVAKILSLPLTEWKDSLYNDFETSIFKIHSSLAQIKQTLYDEGAIYASMSGSGSTIFAIYDRPVGLTFEKEGFWEKVVRLDQSK